MESDLEIISENILNWYSFNDNAKILKIDKDFILNENDNQKYDYIILIGSLPYASKNNNMNSKEFINKISDLLNEDGKLLIAVNNRFALRYFVGNPDEFLNKKFSVLLNYNNEVEKIETYTKEKLEEILDLNGFKNRFFYYPLPDFSLPNVIFSDKEMPKYNTIDKYIPYHNDNATIIMDEIDLYREILKSDEKLFTFFANSFLVEASKNEFISKYKYISFNNVRKSKYRLITKIGDEYVEKEIINDDGKDHYNNIKENIEILKSSNINTVDEVIDGKIRSLYINNDNILSVVLNKKLKENNLDDFYSLIDNFVYEIKRVSYEIEPNEKNIFDEYKIEISEEQAKGLTFIKTALWDMTFKNCFYIDGKYFFFDQEWKAKNMPVEYVLYRSILYTISLRRFINIDDIYKKYNLDSYLDIFGKLDEKLQEEIRDDELWKYYSKKYDFNIDLKLQELNLLKTQEEEKDKQIADLRRTIEKLQGEKFRTFIKRKILKKWRKK